MKRLTVLFFFLIMSFIGNTQTKPEVLTNKSIVDLYKAGLSNKLIISKIENSAAKFDVSTNGLIALKKENISEDIIEVMVNRGVQSKPANTANSASQAVEKRSTETEFNVPEPEIINAVYLYNKSNKPIPLEKAAATLRTHTKVLGYGGAEGVFEIAGDKSPVRINSNDAQTFIVNTGGGTGDVFALYKVEVKKGKRQAVAVTFSSLGGTKGAKGIISINVKMLRSNVFQLAPSVTLNKGEYFFANKSAGSALSSTTADVYAFGID